jgi:hypothetical protein
VSSTPEGKVKDDVKRYLRSIGAYFFMPVQTGYGATALDFFVCYRGRFYGIETKRRGVTKVRPLQDAVIKQIEAAGGEAFVADRVETVMVEINPKRAADMERSMPSEDVGGAVREAYDLVKRPSGFPPA